MSHQPDLERLRVVLVSTRNPLNIGAAARAMSNFGVSHLRVVNPFEASFREARSAVGAAELLAHAEDFTSVADAVSDCVLVIGTTAARDRELRHELRSLQDTGPPIREALSTGPVALLFGSEKRGLSNEDFAHCHWLMRIPTRDAHSSMNLGQAVAVCLYEIIRCSPAASAGPPSVRTNSADLERITTLLSQALSVSGYVKPGSAETTDDKVRRLVRRLNLQPTDAETLLGMLRKVCWKLRSGPEEQE